jgi:hypothetical protein
MQDRIENIFDHQFIIYVLYTITVDKPPCCCKQITFYSVPRFSHLRGCFSLSPFPFALSLPFITFRHNVERQMQYDTEEEIKGTVS